MIHKFRVWEKFNVTSRIARVMMGNCRDRRIVFVKIVRGANFSSVGLPDLLLGFKPFKRTLQRYLLNHGLGIGKMVVGMS